MYTPVYDELENTDTVLKNLAIKHNTLFISLLDMFCIEKKCLTSLKYKDKYEPFVWDYGHLTKSSSDLISKRILNSIGITVKF